LRRTSGTSGPARVTVTVVSESDPTVRATSETRIGGD
jgi:hypothetical protein